MTVAPVFPKPHITIAFLQARGGEPWLSALHLNADGTKGVFETQAFPNADAAGPWISARPNANIYYSVNPAMPGAPRDKKVDREHVAKVRSLHVDLDPRQGEDQDAAQARIYETLNSYQPQPTWIICSDGGMQGIWDLKPEDHIVINGDVAKAEDAKLYNLQLERDLGGDHCHNIDRVLLARP